MKRSKILWLSAVFSAVLAACSAQNSVVEAPVVETQTVNLNKPTAVEEALDNMDYPFTDDTQAFMDFEEQTGNVEKYSEEWCILFDQSGLPKFSRLAADYDDIAFCAPDAICITAQDAANRAGRMLRVLLGDNDKEIRVVCFGENGRMYWYAETGDTDRPTAFFILDAVTGELCEYQKTAYEEAAENSGNVSEENQDIERKVQEFIQSLLNADGAGQKCSSLIVPQSQGQYSWRATIGEASWKIGIEPNGTVNFMVVLTGKTADEYTQDSYSAPLRDMSNITVRLGDNGHRGTDYAAEEGSEVYAVANGTVAVAEYHYNYGNYIVLQHEDGQTRSLYAHLNELYVKAGQKVTAGQAIGTVGKTGDAAGICLHFELDRNGTHIDPQTVTFADSWQIIVYE